jgi:HK97 family phage prohead protease
MSLRYVNIDQFRGLHGTVKDNVLAVEKEHIDTDGLVVLAPSVPEVRALGGHDSRMVEFIITDESIDRMSDKISIDGWELDNYEKNPVVLWAHSHYDPPVGKATTLDVNKKKKQIRSITEFTPKDLNPLGYMIYQMYLQKFMNAVSVGFKPKEYTWVSSQNDAERARRGGIDFLKQELLEYSAVPVPANPNAVVSAKSAGIDVAPLRAWAEQVLDEKSLRNLSGDARRHIEVLRSATSPVGRALYLEIGDMKMAGTKDEVPPTPAAPDPAKTADIPEVVVKEVVVRRWDCGTEGHTHTEKADAEGCVQFDKTIDGIIVTLGGIDTIVKAGRVLSKKNEQSLRAAVEALNNVLAQLSKEDEEEDDDKEGDDDEEDTDDDSKGDTGVAVRFGDAGEPKQRSVEDLTGGLSMEAITRAIDEGTAAALARATGRVD